METDKFEDLRNTFQEVINYITNKDAKHAHLKLLVAGDMLNDMLDLSIDDEDLKTLGQYQLLLRQLEELIALLN